VKGSVRRRGAGWAITYDEPATGGKRRQRTKAGFTSRALAERYLREQLRRIDTATYAPPEKTTLERYLVDEWLPATRRRVRSRSSAMSRSHAYT
jgi:Arm DNA-binding domain